MKLLIVTQAIDLDDPILGFFHHWVEKLASRFESVEIVCLRLGRHSLPANVQVHSLGKEQGGTRLLYAARFGWLIWCLRQRYDSVLVHMNPEYLILGGLDWWVMRKRVHFWYNHPKDDWRLRTASFFARKVFYTSPYAATAKMRHAVRMPAGIDTDIFKPQPVARNRHAFYMQGRITPSKHIEIALAALRLVRESVPDATLTLVGPEDKVYGEKLRKDFADVMNAVTFLGSKLNKETPALYGAHGASINLAADGHYDKSVLESMACGTPALFSSKAFAGLLLGRVYVPMPDVSGLRYIMELSDTDYETLSANIRNLVVEKESLGLLITRLAQELS